MDVHGIDLFKDMTRLGFFDPAGASDELRKIRSRSAVVIIGVDSIHRIFVLEAWAGRPVGDGMLDKVTEICAKWKPKVLGAESNACQGHFAFQLRERFKAAGVPTTVRRINQPSNSQKDFRIRTTVGEVLREDRLCIPETMYELRAELRGFPTAAHKDLADALANVIKMAPRRPEAVTSEEEIKRYGAYLRKSGMKSLDIEKHIEQYRREYNGQHD